MNIKIPICHNCGTKLELGVQKMPDGSIYLYWICPGSFEDDACENNGRVDEVKQNE